MNEGADSGSLATLPDEDGGPASVPPDRLSTLADGVFAIAMTLLVLELAVPEVAEDELAEHLRGMWSEFLMYALSFTVLGVYWMIHHMVFDSIDRYDTTLAWLNIAYLMFAALLPFSTALVVEYGAEPSTACFYGLNMLVLFVVGWSMWAYATSGRRLVGHGVDDELVRGGRRMGYLYCSVLGAALALAFVSPVLSMLVYAGVVLVFVGFTLVGRWQRVAIWSGFPGSRRGGAGRDRT